MPADLYYFISSLPSLRWGEKPSLGYEDFIAACEEWLGSKMSAHLKSLELMPATDGSKPQSKVIAAWQDWEIYLRNAIAELRAAKLHKKATEWLRDGAGLYPGDRKRLEDAFNQPTPRDRERAIDAMRWQQLEQLGAQHFFDVSTLELYTMKLLLSEKQVGRNLERGSKAYQELVEQGIEQAHEQRELIPS
jgi:TfoX/Sxy family transcriptional regulator of competence genes